MCRALFWVSRYENLWDTILSSIREWKYYMYFILMCSLLSWICLVKKSTSDVTCYVDNCHLHLSLWNDWICVGGSFCRLLLRDYWHENESMSHFYAPENWRGLLRLLTFAFAALSFPVELRETRELGLPWTSTIVFWVSKE